MADRSLTRVQGGTTDTIHINTDKFAGVRTMSKTGGTVPLTDATTSIQVTVPLKPEFNGVYNTTAPVTANSTWTKVGGGVTITACNYNGTDAYDYAIGDSETWGCFDGVSGTDRPWKVPTPFWTITGLPLTETVTVDRAAQVIDSDRKGESRPLLSKVVGGAAAAYSLRDLNDRAGNNKVVRVRRASDNNERDFLAKEVSNGTLKNWVNTQTVLPLDIQALTADGRTGSVIPAKAAYSLRNLSKNYTGNVVDVRRFTDGATNSYTADEITGGTLTSFANESVKYLDSTGTSTANVSTNGINYSVVGSTDYLANNLSFSTTGGFNNTEKYAFTGKGDSGGFGHNFYFSNSFNVTRIGASAPAKTVTIEAYVKRTSGSSSDNLYFRPYAQSTSNKVTVTGLVQDEWTFVKGTMIKDSSLATRNHIQIGGDTGVTFEVSNIKFYSENNDVTVSKWYDQSGNDHHAVQATSANQPKIVNAGSFLNELLFEGSQLFDSITLSDSAQPNSIFTVSNTKVASQTRGIYGTNSTQAGYYRSSNKHAIFSTGTGSGTLEGAAYVADRDYLRFDLFNGASSVLGVDGNTTSGTTGNAELDRLDIGDSTLSGVSPINGGIKELILYTSDQTDNRTAIEANIGEAYSLTGIPAYDNTVDGFVETWYDQSGNGNDAVQATSEHQPPIVKAGIVVDKGIDFDGVSLHHLQPALLLPTVQNSTVIAVSTKRNNSTGYVAQLNRGLDRMYIRHNVITVGNPASNTICSTINDVRAIQTITATSGGLFTIFQDGTSIGTTNYTADVGGGDSHIGSGNNGSAEFDGVVSELIVYHTDQSANRLAIEANIKNQYDIA